MNTGLDSASWLSGGNPGQDVCSSCFQGRLPGPQHGILSKYLLADYLILNSHAFTFFFFQGNLAKETKELFLAPLQTPLSSVRF